MSPNSDITKYESQLLFIFCTATYKSAHGNHLPYQSKYKYNGKLVNRRIKNIKLRKFE